jgi:hypothetical protein
METTQRDLLDIMKPLHLMYSLMEQETELHQLEFQPRPKLTMVEDTLKTEDLLQTLILMSLEQ